MEASSTISFLTSNKLKQTNNRKRDDKENHKYKINNIVYLIITINSTYHGPFTYHYQYKFRRLSYN